MRPAMTESFVSIDTVTQCRQHAFVQTVRVTQTRWAGVEVPRLALAGTADIVSMLFAPHLLR